MKFVVLGAGLQGSAAAYALLQDPRVELVTLADRQPDRLPDFLTGGGFGTRLRSVPLDAGDFGAVLELARGQQAVLCALPYYFNEPVTRAALEAGAHCSDLGGNTQIVIQQKRQHAAALAKGLSVIPDCGLAPGMVNLLAAEGIRRLERTHAVRIYVGGLPQHPEPPLNYQIVYSLEGALDYYTTPSWVLRQGKAVQVEALSELEHLEFPAPVGRLEAFHTGGGISTLPFSHEGRIETMEYKTLRYPGHAAIMRAIRELGLLANTPLSVKGQQVVPRDVFIAAVEPTLARPGSPDLVAVRVQVTGERDGAPAEVRFELLDRYDAERGMSAMMRTTGFSLALTALLQADGSIVERGVRTPDEAVPYLPYVQGLARLGVLVEEKTA